jgi:predicted RNase H-like HicB family nuclease
LSEQSVHVQVHRDRDGYWAQVSEWPVCLASGRTWVELIEALEESIGFYIAPEEQSKPAPVALRILAMELEVDADRPLIRARAEASDRPLPSVGRGRDAHLNWPLRDFHRR